MNVYMETHPELDHEIDDGVRALSQSEENLIISGGNITIPVYLGNTLLDEVIVDAQNRQNLRSGGR